MYDVDKDSANILWPLAVSNMSSRAFKVFCAYVIMSDKYKNLISDPKCSGNSTIAERHLRTAPSGNETRKKRGQPVCYKQGKH